VTLERIVAEDHPRDLRKHWILDTSRRGRRWRGVLHARPGVILLRHGNISGDVASMSSVGHSLTHLTLRKEQFHSGKPETKTVSNSDVAQKFSGDPTADGLRPKADEGS